MSRIDRILATAITIPFVMIGCALYIVIGLPLAGLIAGWVIERDACMKHLPKGK